jgi:hypothetical protein
MPHLVATNAAAAALLALVGPGATVADAAAINAAVAANAVSTNAVVAADSVAANVVPDNAVAANAVAINAVVTNVVATNAVVTNVVATNAVVTNVLATNAARVHHAVTVGDCIELAGEQRSEGGVAFVTQLNADGTFDVRWVLANRGETRVRPQRIVELNPLATTARRTSASALERPSILCPSHRPTRRALIDASSRLNVPRAAAGPASVSAVILQSKQWSRHDAVPNPMLKYLHNGREQSAGWLRQSEAALRGIRLVDEKGNEKKHLLPEENSVLVHVKTRHNNKTASEIQAAVMWQDNITQLCGKIT